KPIPCVKELLSAYLDRGGLPPSSRFSPPACIPSTPRRCLPGRHSAFAPAPRPCPGPVALTPCSHPNHRRERSGVPPGRKIVARGKIDRVRGPARSSERENRFPCPFAGII